MENLSFILPVHEYNEPLLKNVMENLSSFKKKVLIVTPKNVYDNIINGEINTEGFDFVINDGATDFCSQVNLGVSKCDTEYFSIVEFDDEYYDKWLENVELYSSTYDASAYLPIIEFMNTNKEIVSLGNELSWSTSFVSDLGYIDMDALTAFYDFTIVGGVFRKDAFTEVGGLKTSMDIAASYEFLMRFVNNGHRVYVVPRIGYRHMVGRDGSFMLLSKERISQKHGEWLINAAKEEMKYNEDRNIRYTEE